MKRIMWLSFYCILAGCCLSQAGTGQPDRPSTQAGPLQVVLDESKAADYIADDEMDRVTTVPVPESGKPLVARADADGAIHLLFDTASGPKYAVSKDNGTTFSAPISVVDKGSRKPGLVFEGWDLAVGKGNRIHVALNTNAWKLKLPQDQWGFHYTSLEPGAKTFAPVRNINGKPSEGFSLAADDKGNVTACWLAGKLYANVSNDDGKTFAAPVEINPTYDPCNCCTTSAVYASGKLAVLYREETNNERDMFLVLWDQKSNQTSRTRISSTLWKIDGCPMTYYAISRSKSGFEAVWPTRGEVYFARLDGKGNLQPPGEIKTPGRTGMRTGMVALSAPQGSTLVAWRQDESVKWQLYDAKGQPSGSIGSAKSAGNGVAAAVDKSGHFIILR